LFSLSLALFVRSFGACLVEVFICDE